MGSFEPRCSDWHEPSPKPMSRTKTVPEGRPGSDISWTEASGDVSAVWAPTGEGTRVSRFAENRKEARGTTRRRRSASGSVREERALMRRRR